MPAQRSAILRALTMAAAALPNMVPAPAAAVEVEESSVQFSHYEEGGRAFQRGPALELKKSDPLQVDTVRASTKLKLSDRLKLGIEFSQDTWSGATPYVTAPEGFTSTTTGASLFVNSTNGSVSSLVARGTLTPLDPVTRKPRPRVLNIITSASAETRNQGRLSLSRDWDESNLELSGGVSDESDYKSISVGVRGRWDFNQKLTSVSAGFGRTRSDVDANLGPASEYVDYDLYTNAASGPRIVSVSVPGVTSGTPTEFTQVLKFKGRREDYSANVGFTQVLGRSTAFSSGLAYARSEGFLENPHKLVVLAFADPTTPAFFNYLLTPTFSVPEKRPDTRNQLTWNAHLAQYLSGPDAALHLDYSYSFDDWGIKAQTFEARWIQMLDGWTITPKARYYTQTAASFYRPYFLFNQKYPRDISGNLDFGKIPVESWSSDQRLSGFGAYSFGLVIARQLLDDVRLEIGFEHYVHAGRLKLGGGGEDSFGDFHSTMVNVGLNLSFPGERPGREREHSGHAGHEMDAGHEGHSGADAPAGVMNAHMMSRAGDFMASYGFMYSRQQGSMMRGGRTAGDAEVLASCGALGCPVKPREMTMQMHMLHLMYAATDRINLMLMPQIVSMDMTNRMLDGGFYTPVGGHAHGDMDLSGHTTGGFGDTTAAVLINLRRGAGSELHLGLGVSIPTGSVDKKMAHHGGDFMDYGMQTGSGTWDFLPSLTMTGVHGNWSWGGQVSGVIRPNGRNSSGYALGDVFQGTVWSSYRLTRSLSASLRGVYTSQDGIRGQLRGVNEVVDAFGNTTYVRSQHSSTDIAGNYGGRYADLGIGLSFAVPGRESNGDRIALEYLLPVKDHVKGYQLERQGMLVANWNMMF